MDYSNEMQSAYKALEQPLSSPAYQLIARAREFNAIIKANRQFNVPRGGVMSNTQPEREAFLRILREMTVELLEILKNEPRCLAITSPCYVFGDIHGNLEDLISLETVVWANFPLQGPRLLFLGDYVDRGKWSVECALYILSLKLISPSSVFLLRGNHEVREIQSKYTFRRECNLKYGDQIGKMVWDLLNQIFDRLPISATIDGVIFCVHGGIPHAVDTIAKLNQEFLDVVSPERDSLVAWEMMWSDPVENVGFEEVCQMQYIQVAATKGFVRNTKRGTAYFFNEQGLDSFLLKNGLTHLVRAHEVPANGFNFHFGEKCVTIFSCSHYCGNNNLSACLLVDQGRIRIIRVDTDDNAPATE